ncbi:MAG: SDR family NAD(P)-dependent oxidoreductase [Myxococcota bacterium]
MNFRDFAIRSTNTLLDRSIAFSYDRTGFRRHRRAFDPADLDVDLSGRRALITGANSGIGKETARALVARGAQVTMLCRSLPRAHAARDEILAEHPGAALDLFPLDLSERRSVRDCAQRLASRGPIDRLIHNAGCLNAAHRLAAGGHEHSLTVNLIEPYRLTRLLLPQLRQSTEGRIIFVSSGGMYAERLRVDRLDMRARGFDGVTAYARAKRAQVTLTQSLAESLAETSITVHSMHPGWADTPAVRSSLPTFHRLTRSILRTPAEGADTVIWLATCAHIAQTSGLFWFDRMPQPQHLVSWTEHAPEEVDRLRAVLDQWTGFGDPIR